MICFNEKGDVRMQKIKDKLDQIRHTCPRHKGLILPWNRNTGNWMTIFGKWWRSKMKMQQATSPLWIAMPDVLPPNLKWNTHMSVDWSGSWQISSRVWGSEIAKECERSHSFLNGDDIKPWKIKTWIAQEKRWEMSMFFWQKTALMHKVTKLK